MILIIRAGGKMRINTCVTVFFLNIAGLHIYSHNNLCYHRMVSLLLPTPRPDHDNIMTGGSF